MKTKQIIEGDTKLIVPDVKKPEQGKVFYNPRMEFDRTLSVKILKDIFKKEAKVADVLSGLGSRAVRYANEADFEVTANDIQPSAVKLIEKNAKLNKVKVETSQSEANQFLVSNKYDKFDCIDIDPFGSPAPFLSNAILAIHPKDSMLCVTATDTGTLAGVYAKACFRRYFTMGGRNSFLHELGVRNLIAAIFREASKYEFAIRPVFAYNNIHYNRVFIEMVSGRKTANRRIKEIGYIKYCSKCERRELIPISTDIDSKCECGNKPKLFGPTWIGKLGTKTFYGFEGEERIEMPYYNLANLSKIMKKQNNKMSKIFSELHDMGYKATKTHFHKQGIKTNAPYDILKKVAF
jgi:tRNA (guanine26-N2/guanine27-N2)-dimethyltransferase